jgi:chromosome segregation ATPase
MNKLSLVLALFLFVSVPADAKEAEASAHAANPIRKVVTLLQNMVKKVEADGVEEKRLYDKFMCYCTSSGGGLEKSIAAAQTKSPELSSQIEGAVSKKAQLEKDVESHQNDRAAANSAIASATANRDRENTAFKKTSSELSTNIAAVGKAIKALDAGVAGSFLQSAAAATLRAALQAKAVTLDADRQEILAFLSGSQEYAPQSGEIQGILKQLNDEMQAELKSATESEASSSEGFASLVAAKKKEIAALEQMLEEKLGRIADLGVQIAEMKNDLGDTEENLAEDLKFKAELEKGCKTATADFEAHNTVRSEELVALSETIKLLNDDDALELFKKTLPTPAAASLLQVQVRAASERASALATLAVLQQQHPGLYQVDFIAMALHGKKMGFDKVIKMIENLVATLKTEQLDDNNKKEYCEGQFDETDDKKKSLERSIADVKTVIAETKDRIQTLTEEISALQDSIAALDKSVAEATSQRREEHATYKALMANNGAAKELLGLAKNRLNKFYNTALYKAPAKRELSEEERITVNMGGTLAPTNAPGGIAGTGITGASLVQVSSEAAAQRDAPAPPPALAGAYASKSEGNAGVMQMIDLLVQDLDKEMSEGTTAEKDAQADYEALMRDAASKRTEDAKSLSDREGAKADMEASLQSSTSEKVSTEKEYAATLQYIHQVHMECDWLLKYFEVRKDARASEVDSLGKASAVLSGADFALLQTATHKASIGRH